MTETLIHQQFEVDAASFVVFVMHDVSGPGFAPDLHDHSLLGPGKLGEHNGLSVATLVEVRVVLDGEASWGEELHGTHVFMITGVLQHKTRSQSSIHHRFIISCQIVYRYTWLLCIVHQNNIHLLRYHLSSLLANIYAINSIIK